MGAKITYTPGGSAWQLPAEQPPLTVAGTPRKSSSRPRSLATYRPAPAPARPRKSGNEEPCAGPGSGAKDGRLDRRCALGGTTAAPVSRPAASGEHPAALRRPAGLPCSSDHSRTLAGERGRPHKLGGVARWGVGLFARCAAHPFLCPGLRGVGAHASGGDRGEPTNCGCKHGSLGALKPRRSSTP